MKINLSNNKTEERFILFNNQKINYTLIRRKKKTIGITIYPNAQVVVSVSLEEPTSNIEKFILKKGEWILNCVSKYKKNPSILLHKIKYIPGESVYILGRKYKLEIISGKKGVFIQNRKFIYNTNQSVTTKNGYSSRKIKPLLDNWYKEKAKEYLVVRATKIFKKLKTHKFPIPEFTVRKMNRSWGNCSHKKKITLNSELIKVPIQCIDYVIYHEIMHLKEMNHSSKFYKLLDQYYPKWKEVRKKLKQWII